MKKEMYDTYQKITRETSGCDKLTVLALGLIGETIEFLDAVDQIYSTYSPDRQKSLIEKVNYAVREAGDIMWYSARIYDVLEKPFQAWLHYGHVGNFNDPCTKSFRSKFRMARSAAAVSEHIKKVVGHGHELEKDLICDNISDIIKDISFILRMLVGKEGTTLDISLQEAMDINVKKLRKRYPEGFSVEKSVNRIVGDV
mgnify:FL=1